MSEPATSLDTRFSDPGSAATPWETTLQALKTTEGHQPAHQPARGRHDRLQQLGPRA
jgi:hypothetical protein